MQNIMQNCKARRLWQFAVYAAILLLPLMLAACSAGPRLQKSETQLYTNEAGYHLTLPADWSVLAEEDESTAFCAPDNALSLSVVNELGGEAYYGLDEITVMLMDQLALALPEENQAWQSGRVITDTEESRRQLFNTVDESGATVYLDITVLQPYPGIRYYLMFAGGSSAYNSNYALLGDIVASFGVDENVPYLYALMEERRPEE